MSTHRPGEDPGYHEPTDARYDGGPGDYVCIHGNPHVLEYQHPGTIARLHDTFELVEYAATGEPMPYSEAVVRLVHGVYAGVDQLRTRASLEDRHGSDGAVLRALHDGRWVVGPLIMDVMTDDGRKTRWVTWFDSHDRSSGVVYAQDDTHQVRVLGEEEAASAHRQVYAQMERLYKGETHDLATVRLLVDGERDLVYGKKAPVAVQIVPWPPHQQQASGVSAQVDGYPVDGYQDAGPISY